MVGEGAAMLSIRELRDRAVIRPVKRAVEDQLLDLPGVTAVDIGERCVAGRRTGEQVIVVSVERKKPVEEILRCHQVPADVLGIPVDVIEEEPVLHHAHCTAQEPLMVSGAREAIRRPVRGGSPITPWRPVRVAGPDLPGAGDYRRIGTLGALVMGRAPGLVVMGLTTFDVACLDDAWAVGDRMVDPISGRAYADLSRAALSGRVDAAAVTINDGFDHSPAIAGIGPITGQCAAYPGELIRKSGYGTALTTGVVVSTDTTLRVDHGDALGVRVLREQVRVNVAPPDARFAGDGDAGATLINSDGRVVGLHIGGNRDGTVGFACPIGDVLAELDVELCVEPRAVSNVGARGWPSAGPVA